ADGGDNAFGIKGGGGTVGVVSIALPTGTVLNPQPGCKGESAGLQSAAATVGGEAAGVAVGGAGAAGGANGQSGGAGGGYSGWYRANLPLVEAAAGGGAGGSTGSHAGGAGGDGGSNGGNPIWPGCCTYGGSAGFSQ